MALLVTGALLATACGASESPNVDAPADATRPATTRPSPTTTEPQGTTTTTVDPFAPPAWLGQRPLPLRPDGFGQVQATPLELQDRHIQMASMLPPPIGDAFEATDDPVPAEVADRSTWSGVCPVTLEQLRYLTVTYWGFDGEHHRGELLVNASVADAVIEVFRAVDTARYPIEEMRIVDATEIDLAPTGDGNNTTAFVCRAITAGSEWSQHAYGLAIDVNPFQNPYVKDDLVLPELALTYADRNRQLAGMIYSGHPVLAAFAAIGWQWGGNWSSPKDYMHFSANGQ